MKKDYGTLTVILPILTIIILITLVISVLVSNRATGTSQIKNENKSASTVKIPSDPQICANSAAGFYIKYPKGYSFEPNSCSYSPSYYSVTDDDGLSKDYIMVITSETSSQSLSTWMEQNKLCVSKDSCSKQKAGPLKDSVQYSSTGDRYASLNTLVKNGNTIVNIKLGARKPNVPISATAKQKYNDIVSTLTFIK